MLFFIFLFFNFSAFEDFFIANEKTSKTLKWKNRKIKNNKNIGLRLDPYVKNGTFEKKITLVKQHFLMKIIFNLKILHEKNFKNLKL